MTDPIDCPILTTQHAIDKAIADAVDLTLERCVEAVEEGGFTIEVEHFRNP